MKNLLCFFVAFLSCISVAIGQRYQEKTGIRPEKSRDHLTNPMHANFTNKDNLPGHPERMNLFNPKSLTWNWDTIITYDTLGLYRRLIRIFDINGNVLIELTETWQNNAWVNGVRSTYTYDANGNSITGKYEVWQSGNWEPGSGTLSIYSQQQHIDEVYAHRYEASFTSFISGITHISPTTGTLSVFPNPANEKITIELSEPSMNTISSVCIYGMDGRELIRQQMKGSGLEINVSSLPVGIYCIRVSNSNANWFGRFIKN